MLNCEAFRMIKPVNSIDDYESGTENKEANVIAGDKFLADILRTIKNKPLSVPQVSRIIGRCRAAITKRLLAQIVLENVSKETKKVSGSKKLVTFYKLTEAE